jgi:hypothetical protein
MKHKKTQKKAQDVGGASGDKCLSPDGDVMMGGDYSRDSDSPDDDAEEVDMDNDDVDSATYDDQEEIDVIGADDVRQRSRDFDYR